MDIKTQRGKATLADERVASAWVEREFRVRYVETPKDQPATVDAIITDTKGQEIRAVVETKCRYDVDIDGFRSRYRSEWLVTWDKVAKAMTIAQCLGVPLVGFLYLPTCRTLLVARISHPDGRLATSIRLDTTETQATVNGGRAIRTNAFIDMAQARQYRVAS